MGQPEPMGDATSGEAALSLASVPELSGSEVTPEDDSRSQSSSDIDASACEILLDTASPDLLIQSYSRTFALLNGPHPVFSSFAQYIANERERREFVEWFCSSPVGSWRSVRLGVLGTNWHYHVRCNVENTGYNPQAGATEMLGASESACVRRAVLTDMRFSYKSHRWEKIVLSDIRAKKSLSTSAEAWQVGPGVLHLGVRMLAVLQNDKS